MLTWVIRLYALKHQVLDMPNQRSSHTIPTPRGGGLAIVLTFTFAFVYLFVHDLSTDYQLFALSSTLLVAMIGFIDDHVSIAARWRFLIHITAASLVLWFCQGLPVFLLPSPFDSLFGKPSISIGWLGVLPGIIFLVWSLNLFNFMDGIDGIASTEAIFISLSLALFLFKIDQSLFRLALSLACATAGFLIWNWPKAKIFMGDVGSGFLGLVLAVLILMAAQQHAVLLYSGLILYGIFVVDASYTLMVRFFSKQIWYSAHCSHTYQHAAKRYGHLPVLLACCAINLCWLLPIATWVFYRPNFALLGLLLAYLPLLALARYFKAGQVNIVSS